MTQTIVNYGTAASILNGINGSTTGVDTGDARFLDYTGTSYVYLPGISGNNLSLSLADTPNITGDLDLRMHVALDDWTPAAANGFISKYDNNTGADRQFEFFINTTGTLALTVRTSAATDLTRTSTVSTGIADGTAKWVRVTLDVDNGASGHDVKFFLSDDGVTWTQLGSTITTAGVISLQSVTTEVVRFGQRSTGATRMLTGKILRAQIFNDITETNKILDFDTSVITSGTATSLTASTGQTVTISRSTTGLKSVAVVSPVWLLGTDDFIQVGNRYLPHTGSNYLYLPGVSGNWATTPDSAALDITGDLDVRCKVALDDWTPGATSGATFISKNVTAFSYLFHIRSTGGLALTWSTTGSYQAGNDKSSTAPVGLVNGTTKWVRATLDVDNGAGQNVVQFFTGDDGINWTQLGNTVTTAGTTSIINSSSIASVGADGVNGSSRFARGKFFRAQVLNGIGGTTAFDANFETSITSFDQTTFTESSTNAATVTINRSGSMYRSAGITQAGYLFPGDPNTFSANPNDLTDMGASDSFSLVLVMRQWSTQTNFHRYLSKADNFDRGYAIGQINSATLMGMYVDDGPDQVSRNVTISSGPLNVFVGVADRSAQTLIAYLNGSATATTSISAVDTLTNPFSLRIGADANGGNNTNMELIASAVIRKALTATEVNRITAYYQGRLT